MNEIVELIDGLGPVPFSKFQEMALYHPEHGFYERSHRGAGADFLTSPQLGTLFAECVAEALYKWWLELGKPSPFYFVDAGGATGKLAAAVQEVASFDLSVICVERSARQRALCPDGVDTRSDLPRLHGASGVVFANELLDNLPVELLEWRNGRWWSVGVEAVDGVLHECLLQTDARPSSDEPPNEGARAPLQTAATNWVVQARRTFGDGLVVAVDYAKDAAWFTGRPQSQWLRTYRRQGRSNDPYADPGSFDITCDVDLGQLAQPERNQSQSAFLHWCGVEHFASSTGPLAQEWPTALRPQVLQARDQERWALTDGEGLGSFRVLQWRCGNEKAPAT